MYNEYLYRTFFCWNILKTYMFNTKDLKKMKALRQMRYLYTTAYYERLIKGRLIKVFVYQILANLILYKNKN